MSETPLHDTARWYCVTVSERINPAIPEWTERAIPVLAYTAADALTQIRLTTSGRILRIEPRPLP